MSIKTATSRASRSLSQNFLVLHRWLGIILCMFFLMWFTSGIVLIYVPFPSLSSADRIERSADVKSQDIAISPAEAIAIAATSTPFDQVRLVGRDGRPLYVLSPRGKQSIGIWADNGENASLQSREAVEKIAANFSGKTTKSVQGPIIYDQWVVHNQFDKERPFYKAFLDDEQGTVLYISQKSGQVTQRTTSYERGWNYVGAVVHWIYPTILRRNWVLWDQVVWWISLAGIVVVILGIWLGIARTSRAVRVHKKISIFRGWMRWHHILGLFGGLFILTWVFSGWLSMDHGRLLSVPDPQANTIDRFRGLALGNAARQIDAQFIKALPSFREMNLVAVDGKVMAVTYSATGSMIHSASDTQISPVTELPVSLIQKGVQSAWPSEEIYSAERVQVNDVYVQLRNSTLSPSVIRVTLGQKDGTWVHVDSSTGEILSIMDSSRRLYRWLFNGLHSFDIPGLAERRPLWDIIIISFLLLGGALSYSGVYIGVKRIQRLKRGE